MLCCLKHLLACSMTKNTWHVWLTRLLFHSLHFHNLNQASLSAAMGPIIWIIPFLCLGTSIIFRKWTASTSYLQCESQPSLPGPGPPPTPTWSAWFSGVWAGSRARCLQDREPLQYLHRSPLAGCAPWVCLSMSPSPSCGRNWKSVCERRNLVKSPSHWMSQSRRL